MRKVIILFTIMQLFWFGWKHLMDPIYDKKNNRVINNHVHDELFNLIIYETTINSDEKENLPIEMPMPSWHQSHIHLWLMTDKPFKMEEWFYSICQNWGHHWFLAMQNKHGLFHDLDRNKQDCEWALHQVYQLTKNITHSLVIINHYSNKFKNIMQH